MENNKPKTFTEFWSVYRDYATASESSHAQEAWNACQAANNEELATLRARIAELEKKDGRN